MNQITQEYAYVQPTAPPAAAKAAGSPHGQQNRLPDHLSRFVEGVKSAVSNHRLSLPRRYPRSAEDLPIYTGTHNRQYDTLEMIASYPILRFAAECVRRNGDTPGSDGETYYSRIQAPGINEYLHDLGKQIRRGTYRFQPLKRIRIPKVDGEARIIDIPTVTDRIVETAMAMVLYHWSSPPWSECSCGYRLGVTLMDVLRKLQEITLSQSRPHWLIADVEDAFGSIPHQVVLDVLGQEIPHQGIKSLATRWLRSESWRNQSGKSERGIPQGSPFSPLVLNMVLDKAFDQPMVRESVPFLRYADDLLLPCQSREEAHSRLGLIKSKLQPWGMKVKEQKTIIADATKKKVPYLGFLLSIEKESLTIDIDPEEHSAKLRQSLSLRAGIRYGNDLRDYSVKRLDQVAQAESIIEGWLQHYAPAISSGRLHQVMKVIKAETIKLQIEGISSAWIKETWNRINQRFQQTGPAEGGDQDSSIDSPDREMEDTLPFTPTSSPVSTITLDPSTNVDTEEDSGEWTSIVTSTSSTSGITEAVSHVEGSFGINRFPSIEMDSSFSTGFVNEYTPQGQAPSASLSDPAPANAGMSSDTEVRDGVKDIAASGHQSCEIAQHAVLWSFDGSGFLPDPVQVLDPSAPRRPGPMDQDWAVKTV